MGLGACWKRWRKVDTNKDELILQIVTFLLQVGTEPGGELTSKLYFFRSLAQGWQKDGQRRPQSAKGIRNMQKWRRKADPGLQNDTQNDNFTTICKTSLLPTRAPRFANRKLLGEEPFSLGLLYATTSSAKLSHSFPDQHPRARLLAKVQPKPHQSTTVHLRLPSSDKNWRNRNNNHNCKELCKSSPNPNKCNDALKPKCYMDMKDAIECVICDGTQSFWRCCVPNYIYI